LAAEYLAHAFQFAHEADPQAELRYNDYSLENEPKRRGAVALVKRLQGQGIPISGLGSQTHANLAWPSPELLDATLTEFAALGLPISITELDVTASRGGQRRQTAEVGQAATDGDERAPEALRRQAEQYGRLFRVFLKHRAHLKQVTFWGVTDRDSWRRGGTPLLFDEAYQSKPAFEAVLEAAREPRA
jgi:endo-1,4-beta-xylanase